MREVRPFAPWQRRLYAVARFVAFLVGEPKPKHPDAVKRGWGR